MIATLELGTMVTVRYSGDIVRIGKVDRVTNARAYSGNYAFYRSYEGDRLRLFGASYSVSANLTTQADVDELSAKRRVRKARKYFEELTMSKNEARMMEAYDKIGSGEWQDPV